MSAPRLSLRFSLDDPRERRIWETLRRIPDGQRNGYILDALAQYQQEHKLEAALRRVLREELTQLNIQAAAPASKPKSDIPQQALDFLLSL